MIADLLEKPKSITVGSYNRYNYLFQILTKIKWKNDTANTISDDYLPISEKTRKSFAICGEEKNPFRQTDHKLVKCYTFIALTLIISHP